MTSGQGTFSLFSVSMKVAPGTVFVLGKAGAQYQNQRFIPQFPYIRLRSMTGAALTTSPTIKIVTNANHDNICPAFTPSTSVQVETLGLLPLASPLSAPPIDVSDIVLEVTASAVGPTTMLVDVLLLGQLVGP